MPGQHPKRKRSRTLEMPLNARLKPQENLDNAIQRIAEGKIDRAAGFFVRSHFRRKRLDKDSTKKFSEARTERDAIGQKEFHTNTWLTLLSAQVALDVMGNLPLGTRQRVMEIMAQRPVHRMTYEKEQDLRRALGERQIDFIGEFVRAGEAVKERVLKRIGVRSLDTAGEVLSFILPLEALKGAPKRKGKKG